MTFELGAVIGVPTTRSSKRASVITAATMRHAVAPVSQLVGVEAPSGPKRHDARVDQLYAWVSTHQRLVVTILAGIVGVYPILTGISKL